MSNRFKLIPTTNADAEETADALSELIEQRTIKSFHQVCVHGQPCFTVEYP